MTSEQQSCYLSRIGMSKPAECSLPLLKQLTRQHLLTVPFENLQLYIEGTEPSLTEDGLLDKIITRNRGGYCFELNRAFFLLLKALGFDAYPVGMRIVYHRTEMRPISHRATVVLLGGQKWFCDVGFGGVGPKGVLNLSSAEVQTLFGESFRVIREGQITVISRLDDDTWEPVFRFRDEPFEEVDFEPLNANYTHNPSSPFRSRPNLSICTESGWISLVGDTLTHFDGQEKTVTILENQEAIFPAIRTFFGIDANSLQNLGHLMEE